MIDVWKEKVALYKEMVSEIPKSIQPTSATWAKKHIFGFSDDEIKLELQQVRMERAVSAELDNTATIITKTGVFDTVDRLYKPVTGGTETAAPAAGGDAGAPPDLGGGAPPPPEPAGGEAPPIPESVKKDRFKLLTESDKDSFDEDEFIYFQKVNGSLGLIEEELKKLLGD
jgi:hypothetical protein